MGFIRTICGDINPKEVKYVLNHEHGFVALNKETTKQINKLAPKIEKRLKNELQTLAKQGVNLFVEATPANIMRQTNLWQRVSEKTGVHVVGTTGFYAEPTLSEFVKRSDVDRIAGFIEKELTNGIDKSSSKAGIIKVASHEYELLTNEKKVFAAAAKVFKKKTGAPITTHSPLGTLAHFKELTGLGIPAERIALGHIEVSPWVDILRVVEKGAMLLFTNFGGVDIVPEDMVIAQIKDLLRRGYQNQILLSIDMYLYDNKGRISLRWPGGFEQMVGRVVPKMIKMGIKSRQIEKMLHENPVRHLTWE